MNKKLRAGVIGATGMVGQRFLTLLENHPFFEVSVLAASPSSAGKRYADAVGGRWKLNAPIPPYALDMIVENASDVEKISQMCDFVFCAVDMKKDEIKLLEEAYAKAEIPVVSNNSANRGMADVPMLIPEINGFHVDAVKAQKERLGTKKGFITVKPNCSIQSYVPMLTPLLKFGLEKVAVTTYQAISGAGKTFADWSEMVDNVIPYIGGEEEKSEQEPLKIWGGIDKETGKIINIKAPVITSQCIRVPVTDGHMAAVFMSFGDKKPSIDEILAEWKSFKGEPQDMELPLAPKQFIHYFDQPDRPQTKTERELENGMAVSAGRLRPDTIFDYKFVGLSHNTLRGAAGGAVLMAEYLFKKGLLY